MLTNLQREELAIQIRSIRRSIWRETFLGVVKSIGGIELSLAQFAALMFLEEKGGSTVTDLATALDRSLPAVSRMVTELVQRGMVAREEDPNDRRVRRLRLSDDGRGVIRAFEHERVATQLAVMELLSEQEQAEVARAMSLLASAVARRYHNDDAVKY